MSALMTLVGASVIIVILLAGVVWIADNIHIGK